MENEVTISIQKLESILSKYEQLYERVARLEEKFEDYEARLNHYESQNKEFADAVVFYTSRAIDNDIVKTLTTKPYALDF